MVLSGYVSVIVAEVVRFLVLLFVTDEPNHVAVTALSEHLPSSPSMATAIVDPSGKTKLTDNIHFITFHIIFAT